jgi:hypothetical protein
MRRYRIVEIKKTIVLNEHTKKVGFIFEKKKVGLSLHSSILSFGLCLDLSL